MAVNAQLEEPALALTVTRMQAQASAGDARAQHQLANLQLNGVGRLRNITEGVRQLTQAAEGKLRDAMYQLGMLQHSGSLVPQDLGEAARWLRLAAQADHPQAKRQMVNLFGQVVTGTNSALTKPATSGNAPAPIARLALVPVADALRSTVDLLTATFSALPEVTLLERAEIERVIREQSLAATLSRDPLKLGQLLHADGVLLLETNQLGAEMVASARLVAVGPGVVLGEWLVPFPVRDPAGWGTRLATDAAPQLRKLAVPRAQSTPISVVGLRMAVNAADAVAVQEGLSRLLAHRLTQERELFVLERQRIDRLGVEKSLATEGETSFWSGAHLLDGMIEPK